MTRWLEIVAAILGSGLAGSIFTWAISRRRTSAEALAAEEGSAQKMLEDNTSLRGRVRIADRDVVELRDRIATLETLIPKILLSEQIEDFEGADELFDMATDGWTLTIPVGGGTFEYANAAFCKALGLTLKEFLAKDWRSLVVPAFRPATERAEAAAHGLNVWGFSNQWYRADGGIVTFRWYCRNYKNGSTLALVHILPNGNEGVLQ
jgi:PAS domain-containing protein